MNIVQAAIECAQKYHAGERFKYVEGVYFEHPKTVSERMHSNEEKVLALLHDVIENQVRKRLGKTPSAEDEEKCIARIFEDICRFFHKRQCDIASLIPDLDVLTKRASSTESYFHYIQKIISYAAKTGRFAVVKVKLADLDDNSLPERNLDIVYQTSKDRDRLRRYVEARMLLVKAYPGIILRPPLKERLNIHSLKGRPAFIGRRERHQQWQHDR